MEDLWQQFHRLPKVIRDAVASPQALATVDQLEKKYPDLDLATFIMRVIVKEIDLGQGVDQLQQAGSLTAPQAGQVWQSLQTSVFDPVKEYLGGNVTKDLSSPRPAPPPNLPVSEVVPAVPANYSAPAVIPPVVQPIVSSPPAASVQVPEPVPAAIPPSPVPATPPWTGQTMAPTGPIAPTQAYSIEDAQEIAQQAQKLQVISGDIAPDADTFIQSMIAQHRLAFADDVQTKRAVSILKARLKAIRNTEDTIGMLCRPLKLGGLGLDQDLARRVVESIDQAIPQFRQAQAAASARTGSVPSAAALDLTPSQSIAAAASAPAIPPLPPPPVETPPSLTAPLKPLPAPIPEPAPDTTTIQAPAPPLTEAAPISWPEPSPPSEPPAIPPSPPPELVTETAPIAAAQPYAPPMAQRLRSSDRPSMSDIVAPAPQAYGPAEEMRSLTLTDWRRLGQGANDSAKKLLEKFDHLKKDSFSLWAESVTGWRASVVYQLYLDMGRQSLERGMSVVQVIDELSRAGQPYLSEHEFAIISDINRQLHV